MPLPVGDDVIGVDKATLDVTDADAVRSLLEAVRPDAVVNAAAYTAVDACETNVDLAFAVNGACAGHPCQRRVKPSARTSSTSAPTTSSTARSIARTGRTTPPTRSRCTVGRSWRASTRWARVPPSCEPRGCAASTATTWSSWCCDWPLIPIRRWRSSTTSGGTRPSPPIWPRHCVASRSNVAPACTT